ncbi:hypothetical protein ACIBCO_01290 [Streptomyces violascens]|uniref:hypothetical protein n=1 Tax=Streptomyces violascens TaxID=67381 RepID=UPI00379DD34C
MNAQRKSWSRSASVNAVSCRDTGSRALAGRRSSCVPAVKITAAAATSAPKTR